MLLDQSECEEFETLYFIILTTTKSCPSSQDLPQYLVRHNETFYIVIVDGIMYRPHNYKNASSYPTKANKLCSSSLLSDRKHNDAKICALCQIHLPFSSPLPPSPLLPQEMTITIYCHFRFVVPSIRHISPRSQSPLHLDLPGRDQTGTARSSVRKRVR